MAFPLQLDSATSLIQAAKNLMNAVVLTVKYSYVASTKYTRQGVVAVSEFSVCVFFVQKKLKNEKLLLHSIAWKMFSFSAIV